MERYQETETIMKTIIFAAALLTSGMAMASSNLRLEGGKIVIRADGAEAQTTLQNLAGDNVDQSIEVKATVFCGPDQSNQIHCAITLSK